MCSSRAWCMKVMGVEGRLQTGVWSSRGNVQSLRESVLTSPTLGLCKLRDRGEPVADLNREAAAQHIVMAMMASFAHFWAWTHSGACLDAAALS